MRRSSLSMFPEGKKKGERENGRRSARARESGYGTEALRGLTTTMFLPLGGGGKREEREGKRKRRIAVEPEPIPEIVCETFMAYPPAVSSLGRGKKGRRGERVAVPVRVQGGGRVTWVAQKKREKVGGVLVRAPVPFRARTVGGAGERKGKRRTVRHFGRGGKKRKGVTATGPVDGPPAGHPVGPGVFDHIECVAGGKRRKRKKKETIDKSYDATCPQWFTALWQEKEGGEKGGKEEGKTRNPLSASVVLRDARPPRSCVVRPHGRKKKGKASWLTEGTCSSTCIEGK